MEPTGRVEKLMGLTLADFQRSIAPLTGAPLPISTTRAEIVVHGGRVVITCEPRSALRLSSLVEMPLAAVTIDFYGLDVAERTAFLRRFDLAFQRGGG
jgi:hypothetical protein